MLFSKLSLQNKYVVEAIVFMSYVLFAMAWVGGTANMTQIMAAMRLDSLADASLLSGAVTLAKIIGTFLAAGLAVKLGTKNAFLLSGVLISTGILTPIAPNYEGLLLSRFLMGLGGAFMIVYFNPIVMGLFKPEERPTINGLNAVAFNVGTAIVLWQMPTINAITGNWKASLIIISILSILLTVLWLFVQLPEQLNKQPVVEEDKEYSYWDGLNDSFNWQYALTYSGILTLYICLFTFYPSAGIQQTTWVIALGILGTLAGIIFSQKIKQRLPVIRWSGFIITLSLYGLSFTHTAMLQTVSAIVLGFFIFFPITALVSIPHELPAMTNKRITIIFSLFYSISYFVATVALWFFGWLVDQHQGDFTYAFWMIILLSSSFFIGSFVLPESKKNR
jgi:MFS family permease